MSGRGAPRVRRPPWRSPIPAMLVAAALIALGAYVQRASVPPAEPPWSRAAPMPTMRSEMPAAVVDGVVYVPGGLGSAFRTVAAFEAYDPALDAWRVLPDMPVARHHAAAAATADRVVVTGGFGGFDFSFGTADAFAFEPATGTWTVLPPMPGRRGAHVAVAVDEVVYVIGGVGDDPSAVWSYDLGLGAWSVDHARLPTPREHLDADVIDGRVFVVGGRWPGTGNLAAAEVYDPDADAWTTIPALPTARSGLRAVAVGGRLHVLGGEDLGGVRTFDEHEIFDPGNGTWSVGPRMVAPRHGLAAAAVGDRLVVIGGGTRAGALTALSMTRATDVLILGGTSTP